MADALPHTLQVTKGFQYQNFNLIQLIQTCENDNKLHEFLKNIGIFKNEIKCPYCNTLLKKLYIIKRKKLQYRYQCNRRVCKSSGKNQVYIRKNTLFFNSNLPIKNMLVLFYCFIMKLKYNDIVKECNFPSGDGYASKLSVKTIAKFRNIMGNVFVESVQRNICNSKIGGPGKSVQIDEAKFGKQKYNRGRLVEGTWVLGGICSETGEMFLEPVKKRDKDTLIPIIISRVKPGTTIVTDCWKAYNSLQEEDFTHLTVNHSYNFVGR